MRARHTIVIELDASKKEIYSKELFGRLPCLSKPKSTDNPWLSQESAAHGAISCGAYNDQTCMKKLPRHGMAATCFIQSYGEFT